MKNRPLIYGLAVLSEGDQFRDVNLQRMSVVCQEVSTVYAYEMQDLAFSAYAESEWPDIEPLYDYVWIQRSTDWVDDLDTITRRVNANHEVAYYTQRLHMIDHTVYDSSKTIHIPQLFPYRPKETQWISKGLLIPKYAKLFPAIQEPYITILDYWNYGRENIRPVSPREWAGGTPPLGSETPTG